MSALERAIDITGGQSELARRLGLKQANVWHWLNKSGRVPAEHVLAIEAATSGAVQRHELRPDLYPNAQAEQALSDEEMARGQLYSLIGRLLIRAPDELLLQKLRSLSGDGSDIGLALEDLAAAARATTSEAVEREYHALFIGLPRGELLPFASYYLTGFLHEKPLARIRADLRQLGLARMENIAEPEDHLGQLFEAMGLLIAGPIETRRDLRAQEQFFNHHIAPWASRCLQDLQQAEASKVYRSVGRLGCAFMSIEVQAFQLAA